jgi:hypothetical protein
MTKFDDAYVASLTRGPVAMNAAQVTNIDFGRPPQAVVL